MSEPAEQEFRGRTTISTRAMSRVSAAVAADAFGVRARDVRVDLSDRDGLLALVVNTPIRVEPLSSVRGSRPDGSTIIDRAASGQNSIHSQVTALTGAEIAHVTVHLTGVDIVEWGRVR